MIGRRLSSNHYNYGEHNVDKEKGKYCALCHTGEDILSHTVYTENVGGLVSVLEGVILILKTMQYALFRPHSCDESEKQGIQIAKRV